MKKILTDNLKNIVDLDTSLLDGVCDVGDCIIVEVKQDFARKCYFRDRLLHNEFGAAMQVKTHNGGLGNWELYYIAGAMLTKEKWSLLYSKDRVVGRVCKKCSTVNEYALSNQVDGSYLCYNCR